MNQEIIKKLKELKPILKEKFGIEEFAVFGSMAREDYKEDSDVDIAIIKAKKKDYFQMIETKYFLEKILNKKVDMGYYDSIRPIIKKRIEKDLIYV
jgi:predicted nucleotidyltransferase